MSLPKFKFESTYDDSPKAAIIQTGIVNPFIDGSGALCRLFDYKNGCESLFIGKMIQKTVIDGNEEGVEAAAVTAIMVVAESGQVMVDLDDPILMILDHKFQFFIYDKSEDQVLFEGRLGQCHPRNVAGVASLDDFGGLKSIHDGHAHIN